MYNVVKASKYYRVDGTDIEDANLSGLARQIAEDPELVAAYHLGEFNFSYLASEKSEILGDHLHRIIIGEEIKEHCFCSDD